MNKALIGTIFILAGLAYGSLTIDFVYNHTYGWLLEHDWIKQPTNEQKSVASVLGPKPTILLYATILIIIGLFILWNRNN